mmetsp:Transcript_32306/g.82072  ORF Transcript_32306/g.82072 Transcript_32306/m.82072 type:complete len:213 (-) Transcript_32306:495-1133(-)|eukprot:CAMPEP_0202867456 /NCGR_PEP_ID=MMETSP1391-20130828/9447_1 /ASSEMBLY_ACC=CAM_ASM_000867 /TAXON_ID=1034604 /ORGANISM="Chlamydomonas leiostraca, Strain SAG 11-49" /LENGTH=212 /DNA_ID=CAMNT_0049547503 /DNA_START=172 /DNA_END=810 /DNA_ORIENTATION=+
MSKKRKAVCDLDSERTLYASFVSAANSVSQLYASAVQQQRRSSAAAYRQSLERVLGFIVREYSTSDSIPKAALLQFLQQEFESVEGSEHLPHQFPVQLLPMMQQGPPSSAHSAEEAPSHESAKQQPMMSARPMMGSMQGHMSLTSPSGTRRATSGAGAYGLSSMDTAEHSMDASQGSAGQTTQFFQPATFQDLASKGLAMQGGMFGTGAGGC